MRWHGILRVINDYRVRAVRVKQHDGGGARTFRTEHSERNAHAPSLPMDHGRQFSGNYWSRIKQDGYFADWNWFSDHYPSSFFAYYLFHGERISYWHSDVAPREPLAIVAYTGPRQYGTYQGWYPIDTERNNNTNIGNNEASGWDPMWILFHDDYYTMAVFERRKSFYYE